MIRHLHIFLSLCTVSGLENVQVIISNIVYLDMYKYCFILTSTNWFKKDFYLDLYDNLYNHVYFTDQDKLILLMTQIIPSAS